MAAAVPAAAAALAAGQKRKWIARRKDKGTAKFWGSPDFDAIILQIWFIINYKI